MNMIQVFEKLMAPWRRKIEMMIARGALTLVSEGKGLQQIQVTMFADEDSKNIEHVGHFGFTSYPKAGAQAVLAFVAGDRGHGVAVSVDDPRYRPKDLAEGDSCLYSFGKYRVWVKNASIVLGKDGVYETMVVGDKLCELLTHLIADLAAHTHAAPGTPPTNAADITGRNTNYVANGKILAKDGGRF